MEKLYMLKENKFRVFRLGREQLPDWLKEEGLISDYQAGSKSINFIRIRQEHYFLDAFCGDYIIQNEEGSIIVLKEGFFSKFMVERKGNFNLKEEYSTPEILQPYKNDYWVQHKYKLIDKDSFVLKDVVKHGKCLRNTGEFSIYCMKDLGVLQTRHYIIQDIKRGEYRYTQQDGYSILNEIIKDCKTLVVDMVKEKGMSAEAVKNLVQSFKDRDKKYE